MLRERPFGFVGVTGLEVVEAFGPQASKRVKEEEAESGLRLTDFLRGTSGAK